MRPTITLRDSGSKKVNALIDTLTALTGKQVLVGIPGTTARDRQADIMKLLARSKGGQVKSRLQRAATVMISNAELIYIHTNGSPLKGIPPRPVIEPAITEPSNRDLIVGQLKLAAEAALTGRQDHVTMFLGRAGQLAENFCRKWFTDPRNKWPANRPSTIKRKGSNRPLIDTGELRKSLTHIVVEGK